MADLGEQPRGIVFGVDTLQSVKPPKPPSKDEQVRIARNATHRSNIDTSKPIRIPDDQRPHINFPEPKVREADGKRYTTLGRDSHVYNGRNGAEGGRYLIGDLVDLVAEGEYITRLEHPSLPDAMPSIELGFEKPIKLRTPNGEIIEFKGIAYGDRWGTIWDGMPKPETKSGR